MKWASEGMLRTKGTFFYLKDREIWKPHEKMLQLGYVIANWPFFSLKNILRNWSLENNLYSGVSGT